MYKLISESLDNFLLEGIKDNAIAIATKVKKERSPEFQKLMSMLDKDRGLMVPFTKWLFGIPGGPKSKESREHMFRIRPISMQELEQLYDQAKEFGLQNIKRDINSFKNSEEFNDYITREFSSKKVKNALSKISNRIREMIINNEKIYNLFRNNLDYADALADSLAKKGGLYRTSDELYNAILMRLSDLENFSKKAVLKKIKKFKLNVGIVPISAPHLLLLGIEDPVASANLRSQDWCISYAKEFRNKKGKEREEIDFLTLFTPEDSAITRFNSTYKLSELTKCYFLFDFDRKPNDSLRKVCLLVNPKNDESKEGDIQSIWNSQDDLVANGHIAAERFILKHFPELNE